MVPDPRRRAPLPRDRRRTVADVFAEERAHLLALPDNPFPSEERVEVQVGKTPYARFDANDYSIPHRHVGRTLVVAATLETVRILDAGTVLATHARTFDRGQQVEDPAHVEALERKKRLARTHRATDRLHHAAPSAKALFATAAQRNHHLGVLARGLIELLNAYGPIALERAIAAALQSDAAHLGGVRHFIDQQRQEADKPPPLALALPDDPRLRSLSVRPHDLADYDRLDAYPTMHTETTTMNKTPTTEPDSVRERLRAVALYGLAVQDDAVLGEPWVERVIDIEDRERKRRSLERRLANARIGAFKPVADFDWTWPKRIDRPLIEELLSLAFVGDATNIILVGPNGIGKTMLIKNILHHAVLSGFTARFTMASDMLHELAAQDSGASLARRLRRFTGPQLLAIDEVGYLNYDNRYADLLFEVVTRRYLTQPVLISTNKPFSEWADVFSSAACVVTLVDRLIHRSEIVQLDGESYRLREAKEQAAKRSKARSRRTAKSRSS